jgi:DNA topoisomerase-1
MKGKNKSDSLFDKINSASLNAYIKDIETGMTAKVFRTYNSSITYQNELQKVKNLDGDVSMLMLGIVKANAKVALLCNHQKNINKNFKESVGKLRDQLKDIKNKIAILMSEKKGKYKEKVAKLKERAKKLVIKRDMKNELKNISLQTSKVNYIDPRITVAFLKKHKIPFDKVFTRTEQDKFAWAFEVDENYVF